MFKYCQNVLVKKNCFLNVYFEFNDEIKECIKNTNNLLEIIYSIIQKNKFYFNERYTLTDILSYKAVCLNFFDRKILKYNEINKTIYVILNYIYQQCEQFMIEPDENFSQYAKNKKMIEQFLFLKDLPDEEYKYYLYYHLNNQNSHQKNFSLNKDFLLSFLLLSGEYQKAQTWISMDTFSNNCISNIENILLSLTDDTHHPIIKLELKEIHKQITQ